MKSSESLSDIKTFLTNSDYEDFMREIVQELTVDIVRVQINNKL